MQPYLVAVDFSKASAAALEAAIQDANGTVPLVLVHAFSEAPHAAGGAANILGDEELPYLDAQGELEKVEAEELSTKWAQKAREEGLEVEIVAEMNDPLDLVLQTIKSHKPARVYVGRQGLRPWQRFFLGSVSRSLAERCPVPLMIIPS